MPAALLTFYRIGLEPMTLSALPVGVAAAVLQARHGGSVAEITAGLPGEDASVLRADEEVFLRWEGGGLLLSGGAIFEAAVLPEAVPLSALDAGWHDGEAAHTVARAPGVLAIRRSDALEAEGLVRLDGLLTDAVLDMRYTTADNFTGVQLYPEGAGCYLLPGAADALLAAGSCLASRDRALLIWDCYRPLSVQAEMWAVFPQPGFVARPSATGSVHNRGGAVDVGLVRRDGQPVPLPTDHDDFTPRAAAASIDHAPEVIENRRILQGCMRDAGFTTIRSEWWHFNGPDAAPLALDYPFPR